MNEMIAIIVMTVCIGVIVLSVRIYKESPKMKKDPNKTDPY